MGFIKQNDKFRIFLASLFAWCVIQLLARLTRIRTFGKEHYENLEKEGKNYILTNWHGRMLLSIFAQRKRGVAAMVSQHVDGEIIARTVEIFGYITARGSSTRGGIKALKEMVTLMKSGHPGAMFPDGPRGPYHEFKPGTITLAQLTGSYIVPMTHAADRCWVFNSWDKFVMAKPFSRVVVMYGEPIEIPRKLDDVEMEQLLSNVTEKMNKLVDDAERYVKEEWK